METVKFAKQPNPYEEALPPPSRGNYWEGFREEVSAMVQEKLKKLHNSQPPKSAECEDHQNNDRATIHVSN